MRRKTINRFLFALVILTLATFAFFWIGKRLRETTVGTPPIETNPNTKSDNENQIDQAKFLPLGNPSSASLDESNLNNFLLTGDNFTLSYNDDKGLANWVMWKLSKENLGEVQRKRDFFTDKRVPYNWGRITTFDYNRSGYERGHLCPSADRTNSEDENRATFLMTNITPQTHDLNVGPWAKLEIYSRSMARRKMTLFIIAGHYGEQGIIRHKITIPTNFWKIIVAVPNGTKINQDSRIIAVDMPNISGIAEANWRDYRTSVSELEKKTGYHFLTSLPIEVQNLLKSKLDAKP